MEFYKNFIFNKPLNKLTISDLTWMSNQMIDELEYNISAFLYIHEHMRQYVKSKGEDNILTGRIVYNHTKAMAPRYYNKIKKMGKLTVKDSKIFRDNGWKLVPEL